MKGYICKISKEKLDKKRKEFWGKKKKQTKKQKQKKKFTHNQKTFRNQS